MRLIDADKLELDADYDDGEFWAYSKRQIDDAPTIEERKPEQWIVIPSPDEYHCGLVKCPYCQEELIGEPNEYHYCPNCGCKMEVEK